MFNRFNNRFIKISRSLSQIGQIDKIGQLNQKIINKNYNVKFSTSILSDKILINNPKINRQINETCNVNFSTIPKNDDVQKYRGFNNERNVWQIENPTKEIWEYQTKKELVGRQKEFSTMKYPSHCKIYRSRYCDIGPIDLYGIPSKFLSKSGLCNLVEISDFIMFNKYFEISQNLIERLLPYCKIQKYTSPYGPTYKIDNWIITFYNKQQYPMTNIEYKKECNDYETFHNMNEMSYANTDHDKLLIVRSLIQIMNESPEEFVNMKNYWELAKWLEINDYTIARFNSIKKTTQNNKINEIFDYDSLIISTENKVDSKEILKILYELALDGGDSKKIQLYGTKLLEDFEFDNICPSHTSTYIETLGSAEICTDLSSDEINLHGYYKKNGLQAYVVIGRIQELIKKYNKRSKIY